MKTGVEKARADQQKRSTLKAELARLTALCEEAKRRYDGYQVDTAEVAHLEDSLARLREEERRANTRAEAARRACATEETALAMTREAHALLQKKHVTLSGEHDEMVAKHAGIKDRNHVLKQENQSLISGNRAKTKNAHIDIAEQTAAARKTLAAIRSDIVAGTKELKAMKTDREKAQTLKSQIAQFEKKLAGLTAAEDKARKALAGLEDDIAALHERLRIEREEHDAGCAKRAAELDLREKAIVERAGRLNFIVENTKKKAGLLRQAKRELEDFHGKPLRHIVIPEDNVIDDSEL